MTHAERRAEWLAHAVGVRRRRKSHRQGSAAARRRCRSGPIGCARHSRRGAGGRDGNPGEDEANLMASASRLPHPATDARVKTPPRMAMSRRRGSTFPASRSANHHEPRLSQFRNCDREVVQEKNLEIRCLQSHYLRRVQNRFCHSFETVTVVRAGRSGLPEVVFPILAKNIYRSITNPTPYPNAPFSSSVHE